MVETEEIETGCPPCSHRTRLKRESGTGISDAETDGQNSLFRLAETGTETRVESKSPRSVGQMHGYLAKFDPYGLGGGRDRDRTCDPLVNEAGSRMIKSEIFC
jgi:hypothetical protein